MTCLLAAGGGFAAGAAAMLALCLWGGIDRSLDHDHASKRLRRLARRRDGEDGR